MRVFNKLIAAFVVMASLSACANEIDHSESEMARNIKQFSSDFEYVCQQTGGQPEAIIIAAEALAWIEDKELNDQLINSFTWNSSLEPFEPRNPEETPTFRLSVMDAGPFISCHLIMLTQAVDHQFLLKEVEDFRSHFAKSYEIGALEEKQIENPEDDYRLIDTYSFQIEIADVPGLKVEYVAFRHTKVAAHNLSATWQYPDE